MSPSFSKLGRAAALSLTLVALACSPPPSKGGSDGGTSTGDHDAGGSFDAGLPQGPQPIGGRCHADGDCVSGHCDTQTQDGYCIAACATNLDCPTGSACEQVGHSGYCVTLCDPTKTDCRNGYQCPNIWDVCVPQKGCTTNADCPGGHACSKATGFCSGAIGANNTIGGKCSSEQDCSVGPHPFCITSDQGFTGGYCTSPCRKDEDCGDKNACVAGLTGDTGGFSLCMEGCTQDSDCRGDYWCADFNQKQFCVPKCQQDSDCLKAGGVCDTETGHCSGGTDSADGGSPADVDGGSGDADAGSPSDVDGGSAADADGGFPAWTGGYPATFPRPPQVVYAGGPVMDSPKFVPIFFQNDDPDTVTKLIDFDQKVGATQYWTAALAEYGVGPATALDVVHAPDVMTGTIDDKNIQRWIADHIKAGTLPAPDGNTLYVLHYPQSMVITLEGSQSCQTFGGYHSEGKTSDGKQFIYAVLPRCADFGGNESLLDSETGSESHEMAEAATDPFPFTNPGYENVDDAHVYWNYALGGSEVGDMCAQNPDAFTKFDELPYVVQRIWSNVQAKAGKDPCQPELPGETYFNAVPELPDTIAFDIGGQSVTTVGVTVKAGTSRMIPLDLYSEGDPGGTWQVDVQAFGQSAFSYALDRHTGVNGDKLRLTITANANAEANGADFFWVISSQGQQKVHYWVGLVSP